MNHMMIDIKMPGYTPIAATEFTVTARAAC